MAAERTAGGFGSKLRQARERRGISLRQIANATKISVNALEALERDDVSRLPGGIFSRAFVRSYAVEVGLDPEGTIQEFIEQFPHDSVTAGHPADEAGDGEEAHESNQQTATAFVRLIAISVPLVAAVVYFSGAGRSAPEPAAERSAPVERTIAPPAVVPSPQSAPPPEPLPPATPPPRAPVPSAAPPDTPPPAPAAVPETTPAAPAPAESGATPAAERITVGVVATGPCWVSAIVDGERIVAREFQAGERVTFDGARDVVLTAGDAGALDVTLNGVDARPLGPSGQVVTVRVTPSNFREYLASR